MKTFLKDVNELSKFHYGKCKDFRDIVDQLFDGTPTGRSLEELPFIPVSLFKEVELKSIESKEIYRELRSSGTQGRQSRVILSKENSVNQTRALKSLFQKQFGHGRYPMVIFESKNILSRGTNISARKAAVLGFSSFASERTFVLNDDLSIDWSTLKKCLDTYRNQKVILFGFTFILWSSLIADNNHELTFDLPFGEILHGGGWKKLESLKITKKQFKEKMQRVVKVRAITDYYGMAEQAGGVFFECKEGFFHTSGFSNIVVRDPYSLSPAPCGKPGLLQLLSVLPISYPGHSILTQDIGTLYGEDDCSCGLKGRYFTVDGRLPKAQVRGCSDVGI